MSTTEFEKISKYPAQRDFYFKRSMRMLKIYKPEEAKQSILKRVPLDDMEVSSILSESIQAIFGAPLTPEAAVKRILQDVRAEGDEGLRRWSAKLDGLDTKNFRVPFQEIHSAKNAVSREVLDALERSKERIRRFYTKQPVNSWIMQDGDGTLGQLVRPIRRVGVYVPGGTAPLPSSVLMTAVPAQVAGVGEIVLTVPPDKQTGKVPSIILAAASMLGIEEIYSLGGAQAIGALTYGTKSISPVDKIFGPGNLFVTLAKRLVYGTVGIDGLAGPTETMIIADETANPVWVAADLLAQAEHDILASAILLTSSLKLAKGVQVALAEQTIDLPRIEILKQSLSTNSGIVITESLDESIRLANEFAPEHLCLSVSEPFNVSERITSAGGIFVGDYSYEVLGDYVAGPSHVMPTNGTARFASPISVLDFVHLVSLVALNSSVSAELSAPAALLARAEGLEAHARAADVRR
jgi:histidinol dehydrogenase